MYNTVDESGYSGWFSYEVARKLAPQSHIHSNHPVQHLPPQLITADAHAEPDNDIMRFPLTDVRTDVYLPSRNKLFMVL